MKSLDGKSHSLPLCPYCEKGEYNLCGHKNYMKNSNEKSKECCMGGCGNINCNHCHKPSVVGSTLYPHSNEVEVSKCRHLYNGKDIFCIKCAEPYKEDIKCEHGEYYNGNGIRLDCPICSIEPKSIPLDIDESPKCVCGEQICLGMVEVEVGGVCHRPNTPCYVIENGWKHISKVECEYHCRCMNLDKSCPHPHYLDSKCKCPRPTPNLTPESVPNVTPIEKYKLRLIQKIEKNEGCLASEDVKYIINLIKG
jgi:hypothetical protein